MMALTFFFFAIFECLTLFPLTFWQIFFAAPRIEHGGCVRLQVSCLPLYTRARYGAPKGCGYAGPESQQLIFLTLSNHIHTSPPSVVTPRFFWFEIIKATNEPRTRGLITYDLKHIHASHQLLIKESHGGCQSHCEGEEGLGPPPGAFGCCCRILFIKNISAVPGAVCLHSSSKWKKKKRKKRRRKENEDSCFFWLRSLGSL